MLNFRWPLLLGLSLLAAPLFPAAAQLRLTEVMSCNASITFDGIPGTPDWLEFFNEGSSPVPLEAYQMRQGRGDSGTRWPLPALTLLPGARVLLFATGTPSNGADASSVELPFRLDASGETLSLEGPEAVSVRVNVPALPADVSFGVEEEGFLVHPTPGEPNAAVIGGPASPPVFSHGRGYYERPFRLSLGTAEPGAIIRFTTDGREPSAQRGRVYEEPLMIRGTTVVRAMVLRAGHLPSPVVTHSFLFAQEVVQPSRSAPEGWPERFFINRQKLVYGMQSARSIGASEEALLEGLRSLPTVSLSLDLEDLLHPLRGIYVNALRRGMEWERPVSLEWLPAAGEPEAASQADAGLRMRGGASRRGRVPKHAFRVIARQRYGADAFAWPMFGDGGPEACHTVDLRTPQNHSWASDGSASNTFLRDVFARDTQRDLGWPYTRGRYVHLFLNGVYWGVYQTHERVDAKFAARYVGGSPDAYDVLKVGRPGILQTHLAAREGTLDAWRHLWSEVNRLAALPSEVEREALYRRLQGCNEKGERVPDEPVYLDVAALIDYMLVILFTGNCDAPVSQFFENAHPNNWFGLRARHGDQGFQFVVHDSEHSLGLPHGFSDNRVGPFPGGEQFGDSNPQWLHQQLMAVEDYRRAFADRAAALLGHGGALSAQACQERLASRIRELAPAMALQAARWGGARRHPPRGMEDWCAAVTDLQAYLWDRPERLRRQLRGATRFEGGRSGAPRRMAPLMPFVKTPRFWPSVMDERVVHLSQGEREATVYGTRDGGDPAWQRREVWEPGRLVDVEVWGSEGDAWVVEGAAVPVASCLAGEARNASEGRQLHAEASGDVSSAKRLPLPVGAPQEQSSLPAEEWVGWIGGKFSVAQPERWVDCHLEWSFGEVEWLMLNGRSVYEAKAPDAMAAGRRLDLRAWVHLLGEAEDNTLSVRFRAPRAPALGKGGPLRLWAKRVDGGTPLRLEAPQERAAVLKARARAGNTWSALALFQDPGGIERASRDNLVITEIMYHPSDPSLKERRAGVKDADVFEFLEFYNTGQKPVSLSKVRFIDGIQYQFPDRGAVLAPGEHGILAKDPRAFRLRYGDRKIVLWGPYAGGLKNGGERVALLDGRSQPLMRFSYGDSGAWPASADGLGFSLTLVDPLASPPLGKASSWRQSAQVHGSPGRAEPSRGLPSILINEIVSNSDGEMTDAIELYNPNPHAVDVSGWFLTDDRKEPSKWPIPAGTVIPARGYWVAYEDDDADPENNAALGPAFFGNGFSLSSFGEEVVIYSANAEGQLTGYDDECKFGALPSGLAYGRRVNSAGKAVFGVCEPTLGKANGPPLLGPVIFTEVHYHPGESDPEELDEFVELWNRSDHGVNLFDPEHPENVWHLSGAKFSFPPGQRLEAGECAVIVRDDPEAFRQRMGLAPSVKVYGPFEGRLDGSGERLTLLRPLLPEQDGGEWRIPMVPVDSLRYNDKAPWPETADGAGPTLERRHPDGMTDEPRTWRASLREGGSPGRFLSETSAAAAEKR